MRSWGEFVVYLALLSGCEDDSAAAAEAPSSATSTSGLPGFDSIGDDAVRSGRRLKAQVWVSQEGLRIPTDRFFDTLHGTECVFVPAADGQWRCLPWHPRQLHDGFTYHLQHDCRDQTPLLAFSRFGSLPPAVTSFGLPCFAPFGDSHEHYYWQDRGARVFRPGRSYVGQLFTRSQWEHGGECTPTSATSTLYLTEQEISLDDFVAASVGVEKLDDRLAFLQLRGSDGSAIRRNLFDTEYERPCTPHTHERHSYCIPGPVSRVYPGWYFMETEQQDCGDIFVSDVCGISPLFALDQQGEIREVEDLDPKHAPEARASCYNRFLSDPEPDLRFHEAGSALPPAEFASLGHEGNAGLRVHHERYRIARQSPPWTRPDRMPSLKDREHGPCHIVRAIDGLYRCLPPETIFSAFSDADCEEGLLQSKDGDLPPLGTIRRGVDGQLNHPYDEIFRVYTVGGPHLGRVWARRRDGVLNDSIPDASERACVELDAAETAGTSYYKLAPDMSPKGFVPFQLQRLPQ